MTGDADFGSVVPRCPHECAVEDCPMAQYGEERFCRRHAIDSRKGGGFR